MIEQVEAEIFQDFQTKGYSRPARLTCRRLSGEQIEVFVKFAGGVRDRYFGLCAEMLCSAIARYLGLLTPDPYIVNLSPEFLAGVPPAAKDLVSRSLGLNFGTAAVGSGYGVIPTDPSLPRDLSKVAAEIFAFDILMQNFDRQRDNPNLLWNRKRIVLIDHESALNPVLEWPDFNFARLDLDKFYDRVFYSAISPADADYQKLLTVLETMNPAVVDGFFNQLPPVWRDEKALSKIKNYLTSSWIIGGRCATSYPKESHEIAVQLCCIAVYARRIHPRICECRRGGVLPAGRISPDARSHPHETGGGLISGHGSWQCPQNPPVHGIAFCLLLQITSTKPAV